MKKNILLLSILLIGFALLTNSCKKDDDPETKTCNLIKSDTLDTDMGLVFTVVKTGDANCTKITYSIAGSEQILTNPTLPWTLSASGEAGSTIALTADATTTNGSISISITGNSASSSLSLSESCSQYND
ncbi:hypothetical protein HNS38_10680 [Lentimicrobium sp. L6]|uniref:hypothetical protein n=1 Tax=Lentimicrobium sp. L6 TaxID=2735916 RepID=UPI00155247F1|nr:hypothetical protein [Lentimicrobium sp. L6]NPD85227.1 hypothetical protein [Lentimicrobium sp. L6]